MLANGRVGGWFDSAKAATMGSANSDCKPWDATSIDNQSSDVPCNARSQQKLIRSRIDLIIDFRPAAFFQDTIVRDAPRLARFEKQRRSAQAQWGCPTFPAFEIAERSSQNVIFHLNTNDDGVV